MNFKSFHCCIENLFKFATNTEKGKNSRTCTDAITTALQLLVFITSLTLWQLSYYLLIDKSGWVARNLLSILYISFYYNQGPEKLAVRKARSLRREKFIINPAKDTAKFENTGLSFRKIVQFWTTLSHLKQFSHKFFELQYSFVMNRAKCFAPPPPPPSSKPPPLERTKWYLSCTKVLNQLLNGNNETVLNVRMMISKYLNFFSIFSVKNNAITSWFPWRFWCDFASNCCVNHNAKQC